MHTVAERYFRWLMRNRMAVLAVNLVVIAVAAAGAGRVPIDYTMEQFFPGWGPERERYDRYKQSFPKEDTQISVFFKDSRSPDVALYRDLQQAARFFEEVGLKDVRWLGSVEAAGAEERLSDSYIQQTLAQLRGDELYTGYLWNADQTVFAVHGTLPQEVMDDDRRRRQVEETLQEKLDSLKRSDRKLVLSGLPIIRSRIPKLLDEDQRLFVGAGLLVFLAVLLLFFRHLGQMALCMASVLPAYLCTVTLLGLFGKPVTVLTGFIPIIVLVVGGSDIVHLLTRYRRVRGETGNREAIVRSFTELSTPCFYTSLTTAIGFASLAGTRIGMVIDFGAFTAAAIFLTYGFSMTLLPVLLSFYTRRRFNDRGLEVRWLRRAVEAAAALSVQPSRRVLAGFALVGALGLALGATARVNTFLIDDLKESTPLLRDLRWIEANGFSVFQVNLFLRDDGRQPLHHPDALEWMADFQEYVRTDPVVVNTFALPDLLRPLRRAAMGTEAGGSALPATVEEADQLIRLAEWQDADLFADIYHPADGEAQVIVSVRDVGSQIMLPFLARIESYVDENPPPIGSAVSTGTVKLIQNYSAQVLKNFGPSLIIAVLLILAVMSFMFRSLKHGLLALIPNFFPLLVLMAVMKLAGFYLKPSTILVFSIAFGLAVDDSIHVLGRFREATRKGRELKAALTETVRDTGPAMLMTSLVVSAGFSLLMLSRFEVLFLVGFMTTVSAVTALATDLFVFPAIIGIAWRKPAKGAYHA